MNIPKNTKENCDILAKVVINDMSLLQKLRIIIKTLSFSLQKNISKTYRENPELFKEGWESYFYEM